MVRIRCAAGTLVFFLTICAIGAGSLFAQGNSQAARVRALNAELLRIHDQLGRSGPSALAQLRGQAGAVIAQRAAALADLIEVDTAEALRLAFDDDLLGVLTEALEGSAAGLESRGVWQGMLEYQIADDPAMNRGQSIRRLRFGQQTLEVYFAGPEPKGLKGGDVVSIRGLRVGNRVAAQDGSIASAAAIATCSTKGDQAIVAILVNLPNYSLTSGVDQQLVRGILWGNDATTKDETINRSVDDFWYTNSEGQARAPLSAGTVVGPYTLSKNYNTDAGGANYCDYNGLKAEALAMADPVVYFPNYSRVMLVFPPNGACSWAGLGDLGCWNSGTQDGGFNASFVWQRSDQMANRIWGVELSTHELGHNLTMHHASSRAFTGAGGARVPLGALGDAGTLTEYGDLFSTMGSWNLGFYNAHHAYQQLGWFVPGTDFQVVETAGDYTISPYEAASGLKALKVRRGTGNDAWLWVESRRGLGIYDSALGSQVFAGALIHYEDSTTGSRTHVLDFTPATATFGDPALAVGPSWTDPYSNVSLSVLSVSDSGMTVRVSYGAAPCTPANPTVTISPSNPTVQRGATQNYTVSVTNNDSTGCSPGTFAMTSTQPAGWLSSFNPVSLTVTPGQTGTTALAKTAPTDAAQNTYPVDAIATKGNFSGTGSANATVPAPLPKVELVLVSGPPTVGLKATVTTDGGARVSGAVVTFKIVKANGSPTSKKMTTPASGEVSWSYTIARRDPKGTYTATATAKYNGLTGTSNPVTFQVN